MRDNHGADLMEMRGKTMAGWLRIASEDVADDEALTTVGRARRVVRCLASAEMRISPRFPGASPSACSSPSGWSAKCCTPSEARTVSPLQSRMPNVLVYAKPVGPCCKATKEPEQIWVAAADGGHPRVIASGTVPTVSPDGRYVAFDSDGKVRRRPDRRRSADDCREGCLPGLGAQLAAPRRTTERRV